MVGSTEVVAQGQLLFWDVRALFEFQLQPPQSNTDFMVNANAANTANNDQWHFDKLCGCAYPRPLFVPHHQTIDTLLFEDEDGTTPAPLKDKDKFLAGKDPAGNVLNPTFHWDTVKMDFANVAQCFPNRPFNHQYIDCAWNSNKEPKASFWDAHAYLDNDPPPDDPNGKPHGNVHAQGVALLISRTIYHRIPPAADPNAPVDPNSPPPAKPGYDIRWQANFRLYSLFVESDRLATVRVSMDKGKTWQVISPKIQLGASMFHAQGNMYPGMEGGGLPVEILLMNNVMLLTIGAQTTPFPIPQSGADPTEPPVLAPDAGSLPSGTYQVGYTFWAANPNDENDPGEESGLSPVTNILLPDGGGINVQPVEVPSGVTQVRYYVSTPDGMMGAASGGEEDQEVLITEAPTSGIPPPPVSTVQPRIRELRVRATYFTHFHCEAHPVKWACSAELLSNPFTLGYTPDPDTPPYYLIWGLYDAVARASDDPWFPQYPDGAIIIVETVDPEAPDQQYRLLMTNPKEGSYQGTDYSNVTAALTRITTKVNGLWIDASGTEPVPVTPVDVVQRTRFDEAGLTIQRSLDITVNNLHGEWGGHAANIGVTFDLGLMNPIYRPLIRRFTGFADGFEWIRSESARAYMRCSCTDQLQQMAEAIIFYTPDFDGHNHYWVMRYLANYAGITDSRIGFIDLVPDDPYGAAEGDPAPFFLPFGDGMNPWTPRARTMTVLDLGNYVRQATGFILFVDEDGFLQYQQWIPPSPNEAVMTFTEVARDPYADPEEGAAGDERLAEYWNLRVRVSNRDVKNVSFLLGTNPYAQNTIGWNFTAITHIDWDSIDSPVNQRPDNYKGYRSHMFWSNPQFSDPDYAEISAARVFEICRLTDYEVQFDTWLQPHLKVMDVIQVNDPRSGATNVPFYIMETTDHWSIMGGTQVLRTSISGKFLVNV